MAGTAESMDIKDAHNNRPDSFEPQMQQDKHVEHDKYVPGSTFKREKINDKTKYYTGSNNSLFAFEAI